jgi:demethylmenaquinone methyltransferase/2-methoxy-6-polyprenyl-1,4-benzoquinol methylase
LEKSGVRRRADLVNADATNLPFTEGKFDVVFSSFMLDLIDTPDIPTVLSEAKRVLREGGRFIDLSLSREHPGRATTIYEWLHVRFPRMLDCRPIYASRAIASAGFSIEETQDVNVAKIGSEIVLARKAQ